jgi:hypothetical protein
MHEKTHVDGELPSLLMQLLEVHFEYCIELGHQCPMRECYLARELLLDFYNFSGV